MKSIKWIAAAAMALVLAACSPPPAGVHEILKISDQGEYSLKGVSIPKEKLPAALAAEKQHADTFFAEIVVSPRANIKSIQYAVESLKAANIRFAFIDEALMNSARTQAKDGTPADQ